MLNGNTTGKLREMKLNTMAQVFRDQMTDNAFSGLSFEERFGMLVDAEWAARKSNRLAKLVRQAGYSEQACVEDIDFLPLRSLDKAQIMRLETCAYIYEHQNIILLGATGSGKSYVAAALGMAANRNFLNVRYVRLPELLDELAIARGDGTYRKIINQYKKIPLLILDEWMLFSLNDYAARDLLEIAESRYKKASTIFCSQFQPAGWHTNFSEATVAEAIMDRIVHIAHQIEIRLLDENGNEISMREYYARNKAK